MTDEVAARDTLAAIPTPAGRDAMRYLITDDLWADLTPNAVPAPPAAASNPAPEPPAKETQPTVTKKNPVSSPKTSASPANSAPAAQDTKGK